MSILLIQAPVLGTAVVAVAVVLFLIFVVVSVVRIVNEYERGVIFRLGRVQGTAEGPGLFFLIPVVHRRVKIDLRTVAMGAVTRRLPRVLRTRHEASLEHQAKTDSVIG